MKFNEFGFEPSLLEGLYAMGFEEATPVQEQAIPPIMEGQDVLACAQTGTGKTAAFLLPVLNELSKESSDDKVRALIIEPTRELAMQVDQQLEALSYFTPISSIAIYGGRDGHAMEQEKRALKRGASIIVATPGRFTSHMDMGYVDFSGLKYLILDEADRMLDMGFAPAIMNIVHKLPLERQNLLFSATMPAQIRKFAMQILNGPTKEISIAISKPAENILQLVYEVEDHAKIALTEKVLEANKRLERVIIFAGRKKTVKDLAQALQRKGIQAGAIHSDLSQEEREKQLHGFKSGNTPVIVATDVLSRGIDIKGIDAVINFDVPGDAEDYVHRIGRTARAEASGMAFTYINGEDMYRFKRIEELIERKVQRLPLPEELKDAKPQPRKGRGGGRGGNFRKGKKGGSHRGKGGGKRR
ncbi:DEAD/DEAH box helicase [Phaeodactylibacter sp.]|uniref:DEAD/DEAH box helicase n=1 Tax=Phaeodactylibacter sp. TaxID=1940289 RepID=UPI0025E05134|nr:DEAD/DEAH box helicase [Phaeodactylibacter sp.]MCI4649949.1 DEAD/DEAH box helicase [Phaeodactylibacter sp.]MCI5090179.1 DEAD/DEAH box helicase [Phaeodactylibacter sp.]